MSYRPPLTVSLLMRRGPQPNRTFSLDKEVITIGRGADNDIVVDDPEVSRHHARLTRRGHDWILEDLGSRNGTFVNGQRISGPVVLTPGMQVGLGTRVLFGLEMGLPVAPAPPAYGQGVVQPLPRRRKGPFRWLFIAAPVVVLLFLLGVLAIVLYLRWQEQARAEFEPPTVLVTEPASGASAFAGSYLPVSATAFGRNPITRAELWVDGELKETQNSNQPGGVSTFYANFDLLMPEGPHMLFVRAVNTTGVVGQSYPVSIVGGPKPSPGEVFYAVHVGAGETLADIARSYDTDPATLQKVNPALGDQEPAAGTVIQVPIPPDKESSAASPAPPVPVPPEKGAPAPSSVPPVPIPNVPPLKVIEPSPIPVDWGLPVAFLALKPPAAPSGLQAQVKDCKVTLSWNDNATNEERYDVWMAGLGLPPRVIAKLKPASGPALFEFLAPQPGFFSFWVTAVNLLGGQPSNVAWVSVDPKCPTTLATHLQVEVLDMTVGGNYDRAYCYVSFEGTPETRLPVNPNTFIKVQAGKGDIPAKAPSAVPIPADGALEIGGECWGWSGKALNKLGSFSGKFATETWDGARRPLEGGGFQMGMAIKPLGTLDTTGTMTTYKYEDPSLPFPYDVQESGIRSIWGTTDPRERVLTWKWDGDPKKITGFNIYLDGAPYNLGWLSDGLTAPANAREVTVRLPSDCGRHIRWQVAAYAGEAESKLSAPFEYDQPKCQVYAVVKFDRIEFGKICDPEFPESWPVSFDCYGDKAEAYYWIRVNNESRAFWGGTFFLPLKSGSYTFGELGYKAPLYRAVDEFVVPITTDYIDLEIVAFFKDHDDLSPDDLLAAHVERLYFSSLQKAQEELVLGEKGKGCWARPFESEWRKTDSATSKLYYTVTVFPNRCVDSAPYPLPYTP